MYSATDQNKLAHKMRLPEASLENRQSCRTLLMFSCPIEYSSLTTSHSEIIVN